MFDSEEDMNQQKQIVRISGLVYLASQADSEA